MSLKDGSTSEAGRAEQRSLTSERRVNGARKAETEESGCLTEDRVEPERTQGVQSTGKLETANGDSAKF
jgi:hypothetical protein